MLIDAGASGPGKLASRRADPRKQDVILTAHFIHAGIEPRLLTRDLSCIEQRVAAAIGLMDIAVAMAWIAGEEVFEVGAVTRDTIRQHGQHRAERHRSAILIESRNERLEPVDRRGLVIIEECRQRCFKRIHCGIAGVGDARLGGVKVGQVDAVRGTLLKRIERKPGRCLAGIVDDQHLEAVLAGALPEKAFDSAVQAFRTVERRNDNGDGLAAHATSLAQIG